MLYRVFLCILGSGVSLHIRSQPLIADQSSNMGFAAVMQADTHDNIEESLHLHGIQFNWAVSITYFMVTALLLPSNLLMKTVSGKRYFPCVMVGFGIVVASISAVQDAAGLLTARFFLGVPESGIVPACIMYFSFWYKPSERAWRIGMFHAANSLASGVGGFLAIGVDNLNGAMGLESWRWLFVSSCCVLLIGLTDMSRSLKV